MIRHSPRQILNAAAATREAFGLWPLECSIPTFLRKPTFAEIVQDRASELITHHDDRQRVEEIGNELYKLATERVER